MWEEFKDPAYDLIDLGRVFTFLLPIQKLDIVLSNGKNVKDSITEFLTDNFDAFSGGTVYEFGVWRNGELILIYDESRRYEIAFLGKERIHPLLKKICAIAQEIGEECIYIGAGQYYCLLRPRAKN